MDIETFELERLQSLWENAVEINLTESGVHPMNLRELLSVDELDALADIRLGYGWTQGSPELRQAICQLYPDAGPHQTLVTCGSAEANFLAMWSLLEAGDEIAMMLPNYMQIWGLARSLGVEIKPFYLRRRGARWALDLDSLQEAVGPRTKAIVVCNPNNPTGAVLDAEETTALIDAARGADAILYADEVYRGVELDGVERPSFFANYDKSIVAAGLSKALAHPGLRIGWLLGPAEFIADAWHRNDYTTITTSVLSEHVARLILEPSRRRAILQRNRDMLRDNLALLQDWISQRPDRFSMVPPAAGGMAFIEYRYDISSHDLSQRLRQEESVFVLPGEVFGMDHHLRIGIGETKDRLATGLERLGAFCDRLGG